jgi:uncharacterized protein YqfA (UPF0365 family)
MDYYRLNNLKADTEMRSAIGSGVSPSDQPQAPPSPPRSPGQ